MALEEGGSSWIVLFQWDFNMDHCKGPPGPVAELCIHAAEPLFLWWCATAKQAGVSSVRARLYPEQKVESLPQWCLTLCKYMQDTSEVREGDKGVKRLS